MIAKGCLCSEGLLSRGALGNRLQGSIRGSRLEEQLAYRRNRRRGMQGLPCSVICPRLQVCWAKRRQSNEANQWLLIAIGKPSTASRSFPFRHKARGAVSHPWRALEIHDPFCSQWLHVAGPPGGRHRHPHIQRHIIQQHIDLHDYSAS